MSKSIHLTLKIWRQDGPADKGRFETYPAKDVSTDKPGALSGGPVSKPLVHYAMCTLPNGHVGVVATMQVAASTRLVV